jgi:glyoxylase I family protein
MDLHVLRLDHLYVTVSDLAASERFYDPVMQALGFKKGTRAVAGEPHVHYLGRTMQYTIRPSRSGERADPYATGSVHHVCFQVNDAAAVDEAFRRLRALAVAASEPKLYAEYRPGYYATFFEDPDGIRLEIVSDTPSRRLLRERWDELSEFADPVAKLLDREKPATIVRGNLFAVATPQSGEHFESLAKLRGTTIERIASSAAPGLDLYDQPQDEWVVLVRGSARLEVRSETLDLSAGDFVLIPAHTPHRVLSTSAGALWLAVHVQPSA